MFQLQLFFLLHCDERDRVVALPRHKFVTGATLLQLRCNVHIGKNIGLGICAWDEITPKNLARFCTSIKYLIVLFSIIIQLCLS